MNFELKDFLEAIGPSASLIFASWIFLTFLQARYTAAYDRYRALVEGYRAKDSEASRAENIRHQVMLYKKRCEQMRRATNIGVVAAIFLILALMAGGLNVVVGDNNVLKYPSVVFALLGLALVIVAAGYVISENTLIQQVIENEPKDVKELAETIRDKKR